MKRSVRELANLVEGSVVGDETTEIVGVASVDRAVEGSIAFVDNEKYLEPALASAASALVAPASTVTDRKTLILVRNPKLAFARIVAEFAPPASRPEGVHPTAIVDMTATLGRGVGIGPYVVVGAGSRIGDRTTIGAGTAIAASVEIGEDCTLHANVTVYDRVTIGDRVVVHSGTVIGGDGFGYVFDRGAFHKFPQVGDVRIGSDVEIGTNVSIDRGALDSTVIGRGTKIDNLVQIAHNVRVGENCVIAAQAGLSGSAIVEDNVILGGQVGVADHVRIESGAVVGAQAGIPTGKVIRRGTMVWGTPARPMDQFKRVYALVQSLPTLKQRLVALERRFSERDEKDR